MTLRVDEHYVSVQGEGPKVGVPTQFLRFGGCNLRCPGWPCDTQHAIQPEFRNNWKKTTPRDIIDTCYKLRDETGARNVCLTGGEPFLQPKSDLQLLHAYLVQNGFEVECFSNGTLIYPYWTDTISFIMDWKLPGSGEAEVGVYNRWDNLRKLVRSPLPQAIKFTLLDENDLDAAQRAWEQIQFEKLHTVQIFYGRVWDAKWTDAEMIDTVMKRKLPWRLNIQVHNYIWDRSQRGI